LLDRLMLALSAAGRLGSLWLVLLGATVAVGKKTGRSIAFAGLVALAAGFAASDLVKELTMRPTPLLSLPDMHLLVSLPHSYASPSGHATSAVASASGAILAAKRLLGRWPL
jgi:undecaprenyl-diphosphatase